MTSNEEPMMGVPVSAEEAARRKAMLAEFLASGALPPLYRLSTMAPDVDWGTTTYGSPTPISQTKYVWEKGAATTPRFEVHTLEFGAADEMTIVPWGLNFGGPPPDVLTAPETIPVSIDETPQTGQVLASSSNGWMVVTEAPNGTFLALGPGALPSSLTLVSVVVAAPV
ncbi:hypothetical protein [Microbacterium panaciterrae]|uniref:Uncharacterized protein n=1 Tax=Microbacterium panaciterrae TaxID=985759 RepID=A0ABP8PL72_9MICO